MMRKGWRDTRALRQRWWRGFREFWARYRVAKIPMVGLIVIIAITIMAIIAPLISPYGPFQLVSGSLLPPSSTHLMGTDTLGRDVFSQVIWGTQVTLLFAVVASGVSLIVGVILGSIAGYFEGIIDDIFSRVFEIFLMIPRLFLIILVIALFGSNIYFEMLVVGLTMWPGNARITRAQVLSLKNREFVRAAVGMGAGKYRIILKHILPNAIYPVLTNSTLQLSSAIIFEASLSFLGLGDPNHMSWGQILSGGQLYMVSAWWICAFVGIVIVVVCFAFNAIGDGINRALNPGLRES